MMQKVRLIVSLFFLSLIIYPANGQINYGLKFSGGVSEIYGEDVEGAKEYAGTVYNYIPSFQAGMFFTDTIFNHFFWEGDMLFSHYGCNEFFYEVRDRRGENYEPDKRDWSHLYYIDIPLMLQTDLFLPDWLRVKLGLNNGFYLKSISKNNLFFDQLNSFDFRFIGGISIRLKKCNIDFEYVRSLKPIHQPHKYFSYYNKAMYISLGYSFAR